MIYFGNEAQVEICLHNGKWQFLIIFYAQHWFGYCQPHSSFECEIEHCNDFLLSVESREKTLFFNSIGKNGFNQLLRSFVIISEKK